MSLSNDERDELRSTARGLLARESSSERVRAAVAEPAGFDRALWDTMAELGWTTIHVPVRPGRRRLRLRRPRRRPARAGTRDHAVAVPRERGARERRADARR